MDKDYLRRMASFLSYFLYCFRGILELSECAWELELEMRGQCQDIHLLCPQPVCSLPSGYPINGDDSGTLG